MRHSKYPVGANNLHRKHRAEKCDTVCAQLELTLCIKNTGTCANKQKQTNNSGIWDTQTDLVDTLLDHGSLLHDFGQDTFFEHVCI